MQSNFLKLFFFILTVSFLSSCLDNNSTTTPTTSSDASFVSLKLAGNDSVKTAAFSLDADGKTIINIDSLPFGTRIDSVYPTFSFKSTAKAILHFPKNHKNFKFLKGSDSITITGKDTVDFRQALWTNKDSALWVNNYASDGIHFQPYKIKINVHKVQPELYLWKPILNNFATTIGSISQKAINKIDSTYHRDTLFFYQNTPSNGIKVKYSSDGYIWDDTKTVTGLPVSSSFNLTDMIQFRNSFYVSYGNSVYSSRNGFDWLSTSVTGFTFSSLLCILNYELWAVVKSNADSKYHFTIYRKNSWDNMTTDTIPANFPVRNFASVSFYTVTKKSKVVVLGGYSSTGNLLMNCWSSEGYSYNNQVYWVDFRTQNRSLDSLAVNPSIVSYDKKLLLFGENSVNNSVFYKESIDEGLSWQAPKILLNGTMGISNKTNKDTVTYTNFYEPHDKITALVLKAQDYTGNNSSSLKDEISKSNRIFLIGEKASTIDIWTVKLNRKSFLRQ